ncbi:hypothetical protein AN958_08127 [Leucoagaricus sp. SymC.cos]|nr:hypothetical protein AN958_08127 [Leucoagaricus sp. SymC.cos]
MPTSSLGNKSQPTETLVDLYNRMIKASRNKAVKNIRGHLISRIKSAIDALPASGLSNEDKQDTKETIIRFVRAEHNRLSRAYLRSLDKQDCQKLIINSTTFSDAQKKHTIKMRVDICPTVEISKVIFKVNNNQSFKAHRDAFNAIRPRDEVIDCFIQIEYPNPPDNIVPMSESIAKHKIMSLFRLADAGPQGSRTRSLCWALVPEVLLFDLTSTSKPSEVETNLSEVPGAPTRSTFLTGRADMMFAALVRQDDSGSTSLVNDSLARNDLLKALTKGSKPPRYMDVMAILEESINGGLLEFPFEWEIVMLEAKRNKEKFSSGDKESDSEDEDSSSGDDEEEDSSSEDDKEEDPLDSADELDLLGRADEELLDEEDAPLTVPEDIPTTPEQIKVKGKQTPTQQLFGLKKYLPQIICECLAVKSGPPTFGGKIIKFVLSDGDIWVFGIVNCSSGRMRGRQCHTTVLKIERDEDADIRGKVLQVLQLLILWASASGVSLQKLFPKRNARK